MDYDIEPGFLKKQRASNIIAYVVLLLLTGMLALPLIVNPEIARYIPVVMQDNNIWMVVLLLAFISCLPITLIIGWLHNRKLLQRLQIATHIYRQVTPQPVTMHRWQALEYDATKSNTFLSLRRQDVPSVTPAHILRPITFTTEALNETTDNILWYADPAIGDIEVLQLKDGEVIAALPFSIPVISIPSPPRRVGFLVRICLGTGYGLLFAGLPFALLIAFFLLFTVAPMWMTRVGNHMFSPRVEAGYITHQTYCPRCGSLVLHYRFGEQTGEMHVDTPTAQRFPYGTRITVEYMSGAPQNARVRELPSQDTSPPIAAVILMTLLFGGFAVVLVIGTIHEVFVRVYYLRAIQTYAFGHALFDSMVTVSRYARKATFTVRLRAATGETQSVTLNNASLAYWLRDVEMPVLYDPTDLSRIIPLERVLPSLYGTFAPDGRVIHRPYAIFATLFMTGIGAAILYLIWFVIQHGLE